ncbi:MAG: diacylglycerol kinase family lipid kinase [Clostridiales bacterium]|nr:diacylglycerol kinase family lipid kinase [Clostridiales bacterium]
MRHLFIINPQAGKGKTKEIILMKEKACKKESVDYIIEFTKRVGHAKEIAKEYTSKEAMRVYSVGGDGTLNEVLNGMAESDSSLAVIPSGSGNDFIRSITDKEDLEEILTSSIKSEFELVDLGKCNEKYFINIASVGLDAEIVYNSIKLKRLPFIPSKFAYLLSIFTTVFGYKSKKLNIQLDDKNIYEKTLLTAVANGKYYGGGMKVAPRAELCDGSFEICHVKEASPFKIIRLFPRLIKGVHDTIKEVTFYKGKKIKIECEEEMSVNIDGELFRAKDISLEILPKAIRIVRP